MEWQELAPFLRRNSRLVKPWLLIFGFLLAGTGCIIYPEIEGKPEQPLFPPEIVLSTLEPPDSGLFDVDSDARCSPLVFKVGLIRDKNVGDTLYLRWLLDWNPGLDENWRDWIILKNDKVERPGREIEFDLSEFNQDVHTLKVVVADRYLDPQGNGAEFPEGETEGQMDTYQWTFQLTPGSGYCEEGGSE
jgi:hypothetical protein